MTVALYAQAPPPPQPPAVVGMNRAILPEDIVNRVEALEKGRDWAELAAFIDTLSPSRQDQLLPTHLKALQGAGQLDRMLALCRIKIPILDGPGGPRLSVARIGEAQVLSKLGRHSEAAEAHRQNGRLGLAIGWSNALAEFRVAQDFTSLLATAEEVLARVPRHPEATIYRGEALAKLGRYGEAEPALQAAIELDPKAAMAWANLACCRVERSAFPEAIAAADQALAMEPDNIEALYNRGRARFGLRDYQNGRDDLTAALALGKADPALRENLQMNIGLADRFLASQRKSAPKGSGKH